MLVAQPIDQHVRDGDSAGPRERVGERLPQAHVVLVVPARELRDPHPFRLVGNDRLGPGSAQR